jgi:hypothetical protein
MLDSETESVMARPAKVWYRSDIGWWMITLSGEKTRLLQGPNDDEHRILAEEKFIELRRLQRIAPQAPTSRTADVIESFLAWSRQRLSEETHRVNQYYCQLFAEHCGTIPARDIKPFHVTKWIAAMMDPKRVEQELERRRKQIEAGEIQQLWDRYPVEGPERLATEMCRTAGSVNAMAARLHLRSLSRRLRQSQSRRRRTPVTSPARR